MFEEDWDDNAPRRGDAHPTRTVDGRDVQELRDRGWRDGRAEERAVLVGVVFPGATRREGDEHLDELARLAETAGAAPVGRLIQERSEQDVRTYIGRGKVEELAELCTSRNANLVVFDDTLSPAQARNLEANLKVNVIDRTELILDIFARHARTREAMLQVELAQLQYMRPRLRRLWDHLSRQSGGIGTRGPGETQLEVDRRRVGERIATLRRQLADRRRVAETQRKTRAGAFRVALVGYTNAGKTALMNALTGSDLLTQNKLFSTLDATTRRVLLERGRELLLTDTVGFIRKLPHDLVASFRTTLADVNDADLILHVVDVTSPSLGAHIETVRDVLDEIVDGPRETLMVFNKIDILEDRTRINVLLRHHPRAVFVSARTGEGSDELKHVIANVVRSRVVEIEVDIVRGAPAAVASFCYREGHVLRQGANEAGEQRLLVSFSDVAFQRFVKAYRGGFRVVAMPSGEEL